MAVRVKGCDRELVFAVSVFAGFDVRGSEDGFDRVSLTFEGVFSSENEDRDFAGRSSTIFLTDAGSLESLSDDADEFTKFVSLIR